MKAYSNNIVAMIKHALMGKHIQYFTQKTIHMILTGGSNYPWCNLWNVGKERSAQSL